MATFFSVMYTLLTGGTWTNYGSTPHIIKGKTESKRKAINEGIRLTAMRGDMEITITGEKINDNLQGSLEVYGRNSSDRNDMMDDVESILANGSYTFEVLAKWTEPIRDSYTAFYELKILV